MTHSVYPPDSVKPSRQFRSDDSHLKRSAEPMEPAQTPALNVLGTPLECCVCDPMTGWYSDGFCRTDAADLGRHTVCCQVTASFLSYSKAQGNDLSTPMPAYGFVGLKPGDHWCVCAARWLQAHADGMAPPVILERCEQSTLEVVPLSLLQANASPGNDAAVPGQEPT